MAGSGLRLPDLSEPPLRDRRGVDNPPDEPRRGTLRVVTDADKPPKKARRRKTPKPPTDRERWLDHVRRSPQITDSVRVLLMTLADKFMDDDGRTKVKQVEVAVALGRPKRRVYDRYQAAIAAGFLVEVSRGGEGSAVTYQARIPVYDSVAKSGRGSAENLGLSG